MRDIPYREKKAKKRLEEDAAARETTATLFPVPAGDADFRDGYRECIEMFALHAPNKRAVGRILDEHCITLENDCIREPTRQHYARYEGYRAAIKDLKAAKRIR